MRCEVSEVDRIFVCLFINVAAHLFIAIRLAGLTSDRFANALKVVEILRQSQRYPRRRLRCLVCFYNYMIFRISQAAGIYLLYIWFMLEPNLNSDQ